MKISIIFTILVFFGAYGIIFSRAAQEFSGGDWRKYHPGRILSHLIAKCEKSDQDLCQASIQVTTFFLNNLNRLLIEYNNDKEYKIIQDIDEIAGMLEGCKDVMCLMQYEKNHGKHFELVVAKAGNLVREDRSIQSHVYKKDDFFTSEFFD